jgi:hypothetical protein
MKKIILKANAKPVDISNIFVDFRERTPSTIPIRSPSSKWKLASHKVQDVSHWKNNELTTQCFTGRASFHKLMPDGTIKSRGECLNINQNDTLAKSCCGEKCSNVCLKISHGKYKYFITTLNIAKCILTLLVLTGYFSSMHAYYISILWMFIPLHVFLTANTSILKRVWCKAFLPWMHLYISIVETYAFCDLCNWDLRTLMVGPPMLLSQLSVINYDALYFRRKNKRIITIHIIFVLIWKMILLAGIRLDYFSDLHVNKIILLKSGSKDLYLDNISMYASKTTSMMMFLCGQLFFRLRHSDKAYAIRTNYTIRSNREWIELNRENRIQKKKLLLKNVNNTSHILEEVEGFDNVHKIIV